MKLQGEKHAGHTSNQAFETGLHQNSSETQSWQPGCFGLCIYLYYVSSVWQPPRLICYAALTWSYEDWKHSRFVRLLRTCSTCALLLGLFRALDYYLDNKIWVHQLLLHQALFGKTCERVE